MSQSEAPPSQERLSDNDVQAIDQLREVYARLRNELGRVIVGQHDVIERLAICLFARGHALLMGVPGLAKTLLVSKLAETMSLKFSRIQFTPDLMPMDITGTDILQDGAGGRREFQFVHGPVFANIVLADEINRAPPKTQAAMLEAMQEQQRHGGRQAVPARAAVPRAGHAEPGRAGRHVSAARSAARPLHVPDRAGLSVRGRGDRRSPARRPATSCRRWTTCCTPSEIIEHQHLVRRVPVPDHIYAYAARLVRKTRPHGATAPAWLKPLVAWGAGPRAVQYLILGAKARAALLGSYMVRLEDVQEVAVPVLTHRADHHVRRPGRGTRREGDRRDG